MEISPSLSVTLGLSISTTVLHDYANAANILMSWVVKRFVSSEDVHLARAQGQNYLKNLLIGDWTLNGTTDAPHPHIADWPFAHANKHTTHVQFPHDKTALFSNTLFNQRPLHGPPLDLCPGSSVTPPMADLIRCKVKYSPSGLCHIKNEQFKCAICHHILFLSGGGRCLIGE